MPQVLARCFRYSNQASQQQPARTEIQNQQNIDERMSSVGLKVICRETVENLLFLENLFLPQELSPHPTQDLLC